MRNKNKISHNLGAFKMLERVRNCDTGRGEKKKKKKGKKKISWTLFSTQASPHSVKEQTGVVRAVERLLAAAPRRATDGFGEEKSDAPRICPQFVVVEESLLR